MISPSWYKCTGAACNAAPCRVVFASPVPGYGFFGSSRSIVTLFTDHQAGPLEPAWTNLMTRAATPAGRVNFTTPLNAAHSSAVFSTIQAKGEPSTDGRGRCERGMVGVEWL
jgi:hypothetical protein